MSVVGVRVGGAVTERDLARSTIVVRGSDRAFVGVSALLFATSAAVTIRWCASMSTMGGMPMAGGWALSMVWMRSPGDSWLGAATSFLGMWMTMMVAMMLPSLYPMLSCYRSSFDLARQPQRGRLTTLIAIGYFLVWAVLGVPVFATGAALAAIAMQSPTLSRAVPAAVSVVVLIAGALQFDAWKMRHLARCRVATVRSRTPISGYGSALRRGVRLGWHCGYSSAGLTALLLVLGIMDLRMMAIVAAAITLERLASNGARIARGIGVIAIGAALVLMARAAGVA